MKKLFVTLFWGITFIMISGLALAAPITLYDILGYSGTAKYYDTGAEAVGLTDTDGTSDDSTFFLFMESAGFAPQNIFGIYSYTVSVDNSFTIGNTLMIFDGSDEAITSSSVFFDLATGDATCNGVTVNIGPVFGFYLSTPENNTFYSHTIKNSDGFDHFLIFNTSDHSVGRLLGADVVIGMEDLFNGGDKDYNDMVVGVSDVAPVPEPATLMLLGSGLLGFGVFRRKNTNK